MTFPAPKAGGSYFCPIIVKVGPHPRFRRHYKGLSERVFVFL